MSGMGCYKYIIVFSLENSFPIVLSGEVYSALANRIDDCNVTMVASISPQHYQKETKQYYSIIVYS
jgi:hypothetical protein